MGSNTTTSSPGSTNARIALASASVAPTVTRTSVSGETSSPYQWCWCAAIASSSVRSPRAGGYWFAPSAMAWRAAASTASGPSASGKPWPRLSAPVSAASAVMREKIVCPPAGRMALRRPVRGAGEVCGAGVVESLIAPI